ncbi:amino acid ABC transporter permease [Rhodobacterales bacterium 52_120_T64]|nr:amino acid ABC transporter permease [Rhodobacterales bacterium 52_120_T64]
MANQSYVRTEMLGEKPPPSSQVGIFKWVMENLFSSIPNIIMSVLSIWAVYYVLSGFMPWFFQSSWDATSLSGCREHIAQKYGEGVEGACWAVIRERWPQLVFGFYPRELYWRPVAALILLFVAISPILFTSVPRKILLFSMVYPFLGFFLLWGGSIWLPLSAMAGFVIGYFALGMLPKMIGSLGATIAAGVLPIIYWLLISGPVISGLNSIAPIGIESIDSDQMGGFMLSITIGVTGIALSLPIGVLLALGRQSPLLIVKTICVTFIEFIRGVPLITLLFVASVLLNYFLPPGTNFDLVLRVMIMVTFFAAAYMAEVIRGGLAALPKGQYEAADALGLDYWKATRLIIMPQALKISIPNIVSNFIGLFKDTTLVSIVGLLDPMGLSRAILADQNWNGIVWELYAFIAILFWVFTFGMSRYSMYLERKLKTSH